MKTLQDIIDYMELTHEESWNLDKVRSQDGKKNCFFGHLFNMGKDDKESNSIWEMFEEIWATTYMIYPVNDGKDDRYKQRTAKQRVIAYLKDLRDGKTKTTQDLWKDYESIGATLTSEHVL